MQHIIHVGIIVTAALGSCLGYLLLGLKGTAAVFGAPLMLVTGFVGKQKSRPRS